MKWNIPQKKDKEWAFSSFYVGIGERAPFISRIGPFASAAEIEELL